MHAVVTGGAGFIGSNLVARLVRSGHRVTVVDSLHTGTRRNLSGLKGVRFVRASSGNVGKFPRGVDAVFHMGIYSSAPMYRDNPDLVGRAINEAQRLFVWAAKRDAKVVFASSSSLYNGLKPPHKEDMEIQVTDYYTEARLAIERLAELHRQLHGLESVGLRFFSCYGPNEGAKENYANIVTQFLWEMGAGRRPLIFGDGSQTRDFVYVDDVVTALLRARARGKPGEVYNVGTGKAHSFNDVVRVLNRVLDAEITPRYKKNPVKNYVAHTRASTAKMKRALKFRPKTSLRKGVEKLTRFY